MQKIIFRECYDTHKIEGFVRTGTWSDGSAAYSKCTSIIKDENGVTHFTILEEDDGAYYQQWINGKLVMIHA